MQQGHRQGHRQGHQFRIHAANALALVAFCLASTYASTAIAQEAGADAQPSASPPKSFGLRYVPPKTNTGAPEEGTRLGGATRGPTDTLPTLLALVPDHVAHSSSDQPTLYWYLSAKTDNPITFTLLDEDADEPLVEAKLNTPLEQGVHALPLKRHGVTLETGKTYEWFVSLSPEAVAGGAFRYVPLDERARSALAAGPSRSAAFASQGYWHDALDALSSSAASSAEARATRANLLQQVGLKEAAEYLAESAR